MNHWKSVSEQGKTWALKKLRFILSSMPTTLIIILLQSCSPINIKNSEEHCASIYVANSSEYIRCLDGMVALKNNTPMEKYISTSSLKLNNAERSWKKKCNQDSMTDVTSCFVINTIVSESGKYGKEIVSISVNNSDIYIVAENIYSHRPAMIRIDRNPALHAKVVSDDAAVFPLTNKLKKELYSGIMLKFRYTEWPSGITIEENLFLDGFKEAHESL